MANNNKGKRKIITQRPVCSRMNFLFQAANLMAHSGNNTLAAYYGKLFKNVGSKAQMHMSPALKRTLCKRCSLPLLPGVNTTLQMIEKEAKILTKKQLKRRMRKAQKPDAKAVDDNAQLFLECSLCQEKRRFRLSTKKEECWLERSEAIVQTVTLGQQSGEEEMKEASKMIVQTVSSEEQSGEEQRTKGSETIVQTVSSEQQSTEKQTTEGSEAIVQTVSSGEQSSKEQTKEDSKAIEQTVSLEQQQQQIQMAEGSETIAQWAKQLF